MIEVVFLGTGGSMPTEGRNLPAIAVLYEGWGLLFDAGEDVQRQFEKAQIGTNRNLAVFISHAHADHLLGLPGLLLRFSLLGRMKPLSVYGPAELIDFVKAAQKTINLGTSFETTIYGIKPGIVFSEKDLRVHAFEVDHRGFALGFEIIWQRPTGPFHPERAEQLGVPKGPLWSRLAEGESITLENGDIIYPRDVTGPPLRPLKIVYSGDTRPCESLRNAAKGANILISEAMYTKEHASFAEERGHSTAEDAARIALESGVDLLVLTHYSPRYFDGEVILEEARGIFPNSILARDLLRIRLAKDGSASVLQPADDSE